jgi:hypothetical protein
MKALPKTTNINDVRFIDYKWFPIINIQQVKRLQH